MTGDARYLKLVTYGRKSGLPHIVELRYISRNGRFYVLAGDSASDWVLNSIAAGEVKVRLGEWAYTTKASELPADKARDILAGFAGKYGSRTVSSWYPPSSAALELEPLSSARRGTRGEEEADLTYDQWKVTQRDYYHDVANAFDSASEEYDFTIGRNFINTWIRRRSIKVLLEYATRDDVLVEVGCGTGVEALKISREVRAVVATDISPAMIEILEKKLASRLEHGTVIAGRIGASEILRAKELAPGKAVRVAYSFNGALNCEPELGTFVTQLSYLLQQGGYFVCSVRNTICLTEMLSHAAVLQFGRATPRKRQPIMISVGGMDIPSRYYPPGEFARFFKPRFELKRMVALPGVLPPAYLNDYYLRLRSITSGLERAELALSGRFPLNRFGDQTLFVFRRR